MFDSYLQAGFECTYARAEEGRRFDLLAASGHDESCQEDYQLLKKTLGIRTVREGLSWHQIDAGNGSYNFSRFEPMMQAAREEGIQQLWDLNHFDFPEYLDPFSDTFVLAYGEYAKRCLEKLRAYEEETLYIVPMNEPSFFSWMCDNGLWAPYAKGKGSEFKKRLIKAAIHAMDCMWSLDSNIQFIHTDPYMYRQPLRLRNEAEKAFCDDFNSNVRFASWDMIVGTKNPELGGDPKYLSIIGMNYYFYNQQLVGINTKPGKEFSFRSLSLTHRRRLSLTTILGELQARYGKQILITETGSYRDRRPAWWTYILQEAKQAEEKGFPVLGICSYPTLDILRGAGFIIPQSGLFDFDQRQKAKVRIPHQETIEAILSFVPNQESFGSTD